MHIQIVGSGLLGSAMVEVVGGADKVTWITMIVSLNIILLGPPISQAADLWGRKWFVVVALGAGVVGTIIVSRAQSIGVLLLGQAIAGYSQTNLGLFHAIISEILPRKYRAYAQGSILIGGGFGSLVALYAGGAMARHDPAGFRNYSYMNAGLYFVCFIIIMTLYRPPPRELQGLTFKQKIQKFDLPGTLLLVVGMLGVVIGLAWSSNPYGWKNAHVLVPFLVGVAGVVTLVAYVVTYKKDGLFHHELFKESRNFALAQVCFFCEGLAFMGLNNFIPFHIGFMYSKDHFQTGLVLSIVWYVYAAAALSAGYYFTRTKTIRGLVVFAFSLWVVFYALLATTGTDHKYYNNMWGYGVLVGAGGGISLNGLLVAAQMSTPGSLISRTSSLMISVRAAGACFGLAIDNAVLSSGLKHNIGPKVTAAALKHGLPPSSIPLLIPALTANNQAALAAVPGVTREIITASIAALKEAYLIGFHNVYYVCIAFSAFSLICKYFLLVMRY